MLDSAVAREKHKVFDGGQHTRWGVQTLILSLLQNAWVCFKIRSSTWARCITAESNVSVAASTCSILTILWL